MRWRSQKLQKNNRTLIKKTKVRSYFLAFCGINVRGF
ncbi:hypothetical protein CF65_01853 [Aggregatibacter actinomycetemcomitans HK1651]|nr:hypothetical protein CF65_01853 [Aggregatibacter actinomycetemcomitans HK1651]